METELKLLFSYYIELEIIYLIESIYTDAEHWELDTIKQEEKLCHLYEKMGYKRTGREVELQPGMTLIDYEK